MFHQIAFQAFWILLVLTGNPPIKNGGITRGAKEILFHVTSDVNLAQAHKLAKRIGYKFVGGSYVKTT